MKKLLFSLLLLIATTTANASTKMIIHQKSGGNVEVAFADKPVATYEGNTLVITTTNSTLNFTLSAINYVSYEESSTAIESVTVLNKDAGPSHVYDLNGRLVKTIPQGEPVVLSTLPQGIYIIKNNVTNYKINKR